MNKNEARSIGRLEGKVDSLIVDIKGLRRASEGKIDKLEGRVAKLEKKQFTIVIMASLFFSTLLAFIRKLF